MTEHLMRRLWTFEEKTAPDALRIAAGLPQGAIEAGFTYTPDACRFCVLEPGDAGRAARLIECGEGEKPGAVMLDSVFELRLFGKDFELRWERWNGNKGRLTVTADSDGATALTPEQLARLGSPVETAVRRRDHVYLLWGEASGDATHPGWTKLTSARIGALWAPCAGGGRRVVLMAREYFETREAGNVAFVGERLTGLRAAKEDDAWRTGASVEQIS